MAETTSESDGTSKALSTLTKNATNCDTEAILVTWDGPDDPTDPYNWPMRRKVFAVGVGVFMCIVSTMNGTIISVAHREINQEFNVSDATFTNSYWPTTSWGVGGALFALFLLPAMEEFGTRPVLVGTYLVLICFLIPVGLCQNFATLIIIRFFSGGCVQLLANSVAGTISNVFQDDRGRSFPISLYVTIYLASTSLGAVMGAAILHSLSWRWIGYIELIWTAALFPFFVFAIQETRGTAILLSKAKRLRKKGIRAYTKAELEHVPLSQVIYTSVRRPIYMLLTEPVALVSAVWSAFSVGTIYLFTQSVEQVYSGLYGWNAVQAGYVQIAIVIGELLGLGLCVYSDRWYFASASRNTEVPNTPIPEARLYASIIGGFFVTSGMFVYAWTSYPTIHWIWPTIGLGMVGFGITGVVVSIANYVIDAYSKYAASTLAAVLLIENNAVGFLPLAAMPMYDNLGFHWASTLLGLISFCLALAPFAMLKWGKEIRARSPFMMESIIDRQNSNVNDNLRRQEVDDAESVV